MKKITLIAVAFIAVSFASCKKAKTCSCTYTHNGAAAGTTVTSYDKISSGDANKLCPKTDTQTQTNSSGTNVQTKTCTLS